VEASDLRTEHCANPNNGDGNRAGVMQIWGELTLIFAGNAIVTSARIERYGPITRLFQPAVIAITESSGEGDQDDSEGVRIYPP
jgi:hypothetical protein